jgi:hypothetical protein
MGEDGLGTLRHANAEIRKTPVSLWTKTVAKDDRVDLEGRIILK